MLDTKQLAHTHGSLGFIHTCPVLGVPAGCGVCLVVGRQSWLRGPDMPFTAEYSDLHRMHPHPLLPMDPQRTIFTSDPVYP